MSLDGSSELQSCRASMGSHDRKLQYRALLDDLSKLEEETVNNDERIERTGLAVREAETLLSSGGVEEHVRHPGEGFLDSKVLRATSELTVRCSEAVSGNANVYDRHELAAHIKENPEFWEFLLPLEMPQYAYLFGTFEPTPLERRPRAPRREVVRQQNNAALKEPENVDRLEKTEEGSEMVSRVNRFITKTCHRRAEESLSYFHLVLDPGSFARTVENVYYVSFLVRDGMVEMFIDEDCGLPFLRPVPAAEREDQRELADEKQFIVSIDMRRWKDLIKALNIKEPMMVLKRS